MGIISLISSKNYIAVNKTLVRKYGLIEAILLGELASESEYWEQEGQKTEDGFFYSTVANVEEATTLSDSQQRKAITSLKEKGVLDISIRGLPAKRFFKLNEQMLLEILEDGQNKLLKDSNSSSLIFEELDLEKVQGNKNKERKTIKKNKEECIRTTRFSKPTVEEVQAYCREKGYHVDGFRFVNYYESKGWLVGKTPMKDWRAAVRTWESNNKQDINSRPDTGNDDPILNAIFDGTYTG